ncbi:unnamed protein product, partial [marine sediment metagenome]
MEISIATIDTIFRIASQGNAIKILNPAPLKPIPLDTLKKIDIIVPNEGELLRLHSFSIQKELSGSNNEKIKQASKSLTKLGVKTIITTLGKKGALIYYGDKDKFEIIPALKVQAVDTVGAGDCFNGCLASALSKGKTISEAAKFATAAASIAVTRKGANQAVASVRSGAKTVFIGKIGKDTFGDQMLSRMRAEGVDTNHIFRDPNEASGVALIMVDSNGENMIGVAPGANFRLIPDEIRIKSNIIKNHVVSLRVNCYSKI